MAIVNSLCGGNNKLGGRVTCLLKFVNDLKGCVLFRLALTSLKVCFDDEIGLTCIAQGGY